MPLPHSPPTPHQISDYRPSEIRRALTRAESFIRTTQRPDGSWYGSWAVCFTYACWFGVAGLAALGHSYQTDPAQRCCVAFLLSKQVGGWETGFGGLGQRGCFTFLLSKGGGGGVQVGGADGVTPKL